MNRKSDLFKKILVANRGEIACRVMKTARQLGIASVAIYSEADKNSRHVALADEAVCIGPARSSESYLAIDKIVQACQDTRAEAVHPGYGFLSENADFTAALVAAGIVFVGPPAHAIRCLGDKLTAKRLAREAGVNTIPGGEEAAGDADDAVRIAREIGYPVMLKPSAGGGGKGMGIARNDAECCEAYARATSEAQASFGDDRIFIEKLIDEPRHIEIQVLGDQHGNIIHLGERECSLQRRHQKVIEESPSTVVGEELRAAMGRQAVALAAAVDYQSAGTVEFLVDAHGDFFFLEMNTRLQVEHPVTELVTGLDLVELMIRVAAGESLPLSQADVARNGHAIEARVYAEDPSRNFLPSAGRLVRYQPPRESDGVRVDTGVVEGDEISIHYDPLVAKLIAHGKTRDQAIQRMRTALDEFCIRGISHNLSFLAALVDHHRFAEGRLSTSMLDEIYPDGFDATDHVDAQHGLLLAVAGVIHRRHCERAATLSDQLPEYGPAIGKEWVVVTAGRQHPISISPSDGGYEVAVEGSTYRITTRWQCGESRFRAKINDAEICVQVERRELTYHLRHGGVQLDAMVLSPRAAELLARTPSKTRRERTKYLRSPMPGLLTTLAVGAGEHVKSGQDLAVVEAMKMENVLRAERDGTIAKVLVAVGDTLDVDQPILEFE